VTAPVDVRDQAIAEIRRDIAGMKRRRITHRVATVTAADPVTSTFTADLLDGQKLAGIAAPAQQLPEAGQQVTLQMEGATPRFIPAGVGVNAIGDREVSSVSAALLAGGTVIADLTIASSVLTASSGQRAGITPLGVQAWDGGDNITVHLDGITNLLQGTTQTAPDGQRRVVIGAAGASGRIALITPDGTETEVTSYAEGGVESIRVGNPVQDTWAGWNAATVQGNEIIRIASGQQVHYFGGDTSGAKLWIVNQASDSGSPGVQPTATERFKIDTSRIVMRAPDVDSSIEITTGLIRHFLGTVAAQGSLDIVRHGVADSRSRSPVLKFRAEGGTQAGHLKYVIDSGGANPRLEVTDTSDSSYGPIWASAFTVSSAPDGKEEIADVDTQTMLDRLRAMRVRSWRVRQENGHLSPLRYGLVTTEAPQEIVEGENEAINLYSTLAFAIGGLQRVFVILGNARDRVLTLEQQVAALTTRVNKLDGGLPL
jgi:hypothetical protein